MFYKMCRVVVVVLWLTCGLSMRVQAISHNDSSTVFAEIGRECQHIDSGINDFEKTEKRILGYSTEGGFLVGYFQGDTLKKMLAHFYRETGQSLYEYYLKDNKIFCIFGSIIDYNQPFHVEGYYIKRIEHERFYFADGRLILWIDDECKKVDPYIKSHADEVKSLLDDSAEFSKILKAARRENHTP